MDVVAEVVYLYLYDLGGSLDLDRVRERLNVTTGDLRRELKMPRYLSVRPRPLSFEMSSGKIVVSGVTRNIRTEVRLHSVGGLSILFRIQFEGRLEELISYSSADGLKAFQEGHEVDFKKLSRNIAVQMSDKLGECVFRRYEKEESPEEYFVFCISSLPRDVDVADFLQRNRKLLTAILREIEDVNRVSESECESALRYAVTYSSDYVVVVDWASSIIMQSSRDYEDYLLTIELANLQLLQLRIFDRLMDKMIDKASFDTRYLSNPSWHSMLFTRRLSATLTDLVKMRMEMADILDKVLNISKFFGDYTLARLYEHLSARLHLQQWEETVSKKLAILEDLYQMASDKIAGRRMIVLEALIVLLFIFEVLINIFKFFS